MSCIVRTVIRIAIGILFVYSGYVKAIDPVGSAIKFGEYFEAFGTHFLVSGSLIFGVLLAMVELITGLCFLFGLHIRLASLVSVLFMTFMTGLTFVLALTNLVQDCGCFGDAIKLTNWQTFYKNLIIDPFVVYIFVERKKYRQIVTPKTEWATLAMMVVATAGLALFCYRHLPLIDFIAYKVGVNIPEAMTVPENAPVDEYEAGKYIYEKNGEQQTFTIDNLPDSTWIFVDAPKPKLLKKGYVAPAHDFSISSPEGNIHENIFATGGYAIFITAVDITKMKTGKLAQMNEIAGYAAQNGVNCIMLSGSSDQTNEVYARENGLNCPVYFTDATILKSMVRANPGMILLKDNTILKKWNYNDFPSIDELKQLMALPPKTVIANHYKYYNTINHVIIGLIALLFVLFSVTSLRKRKI
ncbi:MAG: DoxX family protein [Prevotellaceae bacterium]|jgi:uncharacterized membrane protein YphA (DoxX/SURF4 family)|nr:DoxX family protein [Prevotellaceae bacterium]